VVARTVFPERFLPDRGLLPKLLLQERLQALDVVADGEFVTVVVELLAVALDEVDHLGGAVEAGPEYFIDALRNTSPFFSQLFLFVLFVLSLYW
jgi:hypothetical protein